MRRRLDVELVRRGLVSSREQARAAIEAGQVLVGGAPAAKATRMVDAGEAVSVVGPRPRFVSRGGEKLDAALDRFGIDVGGLHALDAGASTGGFTDCLLQRGARSVTAVDVGRGQLNERLRADERVTSLERTDIRSFRATEPYPIVVADLSFISLRGVGEALLGANAAAGADVVVLLKPQFEAGRAEASKGKGVIRDPEVWGRVLVEVTSALTDHGAAMMEAMVSPLLGADGNVEFLLHLRAHSPAGPPADFGALVAAARQASASAAASPVTTPPVPAPDDAS
jgi:23S rRNA (cytidine1920-2'-O)/16S rRNA (cytidine1409-2'-O)-methyltransferase